MDNRYDPKHPRHRELMLPCCPHHEEAPSTKLCINVAHNELSCAVAYVETCEFCEHCRAVQTDLAYEAINRKLDADTRGGILCHVCLQFQFRNGDYEGYVIEKLYDDSSDACYNCHGVA
jgi:hypothetical protein